MSPLRRRMLEFVAATAALHGTAIALYYALDIRGAPLTRQRMFGWVWMGATVALIVLALQRIKRARRASRR